MKTLKYWQYEEGEEFFEYLYTKYYKQRKKKRIVKK